MSTKEIIIGREHEKAQLEKAFNSKKAEFIVAYGRRRVGKTYLIRRFFSNKKCLFFQLTGIHKASAKVQLQEFTKELKQVFYPGKLQLTAPTNWFDALELLTEAMTQQAQQQKVVYLTNSCYASNMKSLRDGGFLGGRIAILPPKFEHKLCLCSNSKQRYSCYAFCVT